MTWQNFWTHPYWDHLDKVGIAAALIAMCFSMMVWFNQRRKQRYDNDLIRIGLQVSDTGLLATLKGGIRRKNLTRAEVLGLLGMLPKRAGDTSRYCLEGLSHAVFFDELEAAQVDGTVRDVVIPCSQAEFEQFDPVKIYDVCTIEEGTVL